MKSINIFISYRRNDSAGHARALYNELKKEFNVFFDTEHIEYGDKFPESIQKGLEKADIILVILADDADAEFKWRLDKGIKDYVALEIEYAQQLNKDIIPITINTVNNMPKVSSLPKEIEFFPNLNAYTVRHDKFFVDIVGLKNRIRDRHFQLYAWHIIVILMIFLGIIFSFEAPREFVIDIKDEIVKKINEKPKKKYTFSLTDNLSPYSLMPNPTFEEWKKFSTGINLHSKESYAKFINIKNEIEKNNLLKPSYAPSYSSSSTSIDLDSEVVTHTESHSGNSSTLSTSILKRLLDLKEKSPNTLVDYYIGIIKLNFGNNQIEELKSAISNIKNRNYKEYAYDLEQISIVIQDKNLSKINKNNHLLNPQYYLDLNVTNRLTDISLLKEMGYTLASYNIIIQDKNISDELQIDAVKSFLKKDKKFKKRNGYLVLTTYINFFNEKSKRKIVRLVKKYPIDLKNKTYLLILLSMNKYVDLEEFIDILDYEDDFFDDIDAKTTHLKEKLIEIKKGKKDISNIFDFFYRKESLFSDTLKIVRLTKRVLERKEECLSETELTAKSFLLYIQNLNSLDKEEAILYQKYLNSFYHTHRTNYTKCINKNSNLPLEVDSFAINVKLTKVLFDVQLDMMIEDMNRRKEQNMLISQQDEQQMKLINTLIQCVQNRDSCENLMELAPAFDNLIDNFLKDFLSDEDMPIIITNILNTIERIYKRNREDILIGKLPVEEFIAQFSNEFKVLMNDTLKLDKNSCYFLYAYEELSTKMDDKNLSIENIFGNSYQKLCTPYRANYTQDRANYTQGKDFVVHFISQTIYADFVKDINISTDTKTLNKIASQYDLKLFNLLSHSFYEEDAIHLKRLIKLYKYQYEPSLVNILLLNYFLVYNEELSEDKYIILSNEISSLREGEYLYNFNLDKILKKEIGYINLIFFKSIKVTSSWHDISWSYNYKYVMGSLYSRNRPTLTVNIKGNLQNFLDYSKFRRLIKKQKKLDDMKIIELLKKKYSKKELLTLLNFFINDTVGKDKIWAYHEVTKLANKEDVDVSYEYLMLGTLYKLNNEENLSKVYYKKSKDSYLNWMDRNTSESYSYTNLFKLSLIQDEPFDKNIEKEFIKRFKDDNETFIYYEARKLLSDISFEKDFNLKNWFNKYQKVPIEIDSFHVNAWIETKQDFIEKYNLVDAVTLFKTHFDFEKAIERYSDKIKELEDNNDSNTSKDELVRNYREIGFVYKYLGKTNLEIENLYKAIKIEESMQFVNKVSLAMDYYRLSQIYYNKKDSKEVGKIYEKIIELTKDLEGQKNFYFIYDFLANLFLESSEFEKSNKYLNKAIVRAKKEFQKNKNNFELNKQIYNYYISKIKNYQKLNKLDTASAEYTEMMIFLQKIPNITSLNLNELAYTNAKKILKNYNQKGDNYKSQKQEDKVISNYIKGLGLFNKFSYLDKNNTTWQNEIFIQQIKIADSLKGKKKYNEALKYHQDALRVMKKLYDKNSSILSWQLNLSLVYDRMGDIFSLIKKPNDALENYSNSFDIIQSAIDLNKTNQQLKTRLKASKNHIAETSIHIGNIHRYKKEYDKALKFYKKALLFRNELYQLNPKNRKIERELHQNYEKIATLYSQIKKLDKSKVFYTKALQITNCNYAFLNLYKLHIVTNTDINQSTETEYIEKYKDKKEHFIIYEMLKIIKNIANKKEVDIESWKTKYSNITFCWSWKQVEEWSETLTDTEIKEKIIETISVFKEHQKVNSKKSKKSNSLKL